MSRFIDGHRDRFGVEPICQVLEIAPSTYYAGRDREPSCRQQHDEVLKELELDNVRVGGQRISITARRRSDGSSVAEVHGRIGALRVVDGPPPWWRAGD